MTSLAASDHKAIFAFAEPPWRALGIKEAMAKALEFNPDRRVRIMQEALAFDQTQFDLMNANTSAVRQLNDAQSAADSIADRAIALSSELRVVGTDARRRAVLSRIQSSLSFPIATGEDIADSDLDALVTPMRERVTGPDAGWVS